MNTETIYYLTCLQDDEVLYKYRLVLIHKDSEAKRVLKNKRKLHPNQKFILEAEVYEVDNTPLQYPIQKLYGYTLIDDTKNMKQEPRSSFFDNFDDDMAAVIIKDGGKMIGIKIPLFKCLLLLDGLTLLANDPRMDERAVNDVEDMIEGLVITLSKASPRFARLVTDVTDKIMEVN